MGDFSTGRPQSYPQGMTGGSILKHAIFEYPTARHFMQIGSFYLSIYGLYYGHYLPYYGNRNPIYLVKYDKWPRSICQNGAII